MRLVKIECWVLEDASAAIRTLRRMLYEIFTDRCQVLFVQTLLTLHFVLTMGKSTSLPLRQIFAWLALQPKLAKFSFKFSLPRLSLRIRVIAIFSFSIFTRSEVLNRRRCLQSLSKFLFVDSFFIYVWKVRSFLWIRMRGCCSCLRCVVSLIDVIMFLIRSD
jgi:hypothetical protein